MSKQITIRFQEDMIAQIQNWADKNHLGFHIALKRLIERGLAPNLMDMVSASGLMSGDATYLDSMSQANRDAEEDKSLAGISSENGLANMASEEKVIPFDDWLSKL